MNGLHDLGGLHGLGPVAVESEEPVFHADWERRVIGIMLALAGQGRYNADEFRAVRETIPPSRYLTTSYYALWLYGVERLIEPDVTPSDVAARAEALESGREPGERRDPELAERLHAGLVAGLDTAGPAPAPHRFDVGDVVTTRNDHPVRHTRLPRYVRGRRGVVESRYPAFPLPDRNGHGQDPTPENLYCVRFEGTELWGADAEPGTQLCIDLWESYLVPERAEVTAPPSPKAGP